LNDYSKPYIFRELFTREKMYEIIAIFRSRAQAIDCNTKLKSMGIAAELINTPQKAGKECGGLVKIKKKQIKKNVGENKQERGGTGEVYNTKI